MLTEPTLDRLRALRLGAMADAYRTQLQDPAIGALSFDDVSACSSTPSTSRATIANSAIV